MPKPFIFRASVVLLTISGAVLWVLRETDDVDEVFETSGSSPSTHRFNKSTAGVPTGADESAGPRPSPRHAAGVVENARQLRAEKRHALEADRAELQSMVESLLHFQDDQLYGFAAGLELPENPVRVTLPEYLEARRELQRYKAGGLGPKHPSLIAKVEQIDEKKRQLDEGVSQLRAVVMAQLALTNDRLRRSQPPAPSASAR